MMNRLRDVLKSSCRAVPVSLYLGVRPPILKPRCQHLHPFGEPFQRIGDGRVVLSWDHVRRGAADWSDGQNVVLHEFAHQLDSESGSNNGAPYLGSEQRYRDWSAVLSRAYESLRHDAMWQHHSVLDHYGATNPAEFFAVATETFFEKPWQMAERHAALFAELFKYYRVDPRAWLPEPEPSFQEDNEGVHYGRWQ